MNGCEFVIEGLMPERAVDKLVRGGVPVLSAHRQQKNAVRLRVDRKHGKKVFAILQGSCYNIKKVRFVAWERLRRCLFRCAGMLAGSVFFVCAVCFFQSRVLKINVIGSGAYLEAEILEVLARGGTGLFLPPPGDRAAITAQILALPRVNFCSLRHGGGILTVRVEVSDDAPALSGEPLRAPADGVIETLTVVRGTARFSVGDAVTRGDVVVANAAEFGGEEYTVTVIAGVSVRYSVSEEYALGREEALAQACLDHGELSDLHMRQTENGWRIEGTARAYAAVNLG